MNLSEPQRDAMLTLANTISGHDFVPQVILDDLLSIGLVYWRNEDQVDFTPAGEKVYQELLPNDVLSPSATGHLMARGGRGLRVGMCRPDHPFLFSRQFLSPQPPADIPPSPLSSY